MFQVTRTADGLGMTFTYNLWLDAAGLCEGDSELISQVGDPEALRLPRQACATAARCQTLSQASSEHRLAVPSLPLPTAASPSLGGVCSLRFLSPLLHAQRPWGHYPAKAPEGT